jgi:hypothetical protein
MPNLAAPTDRSVLRRAAGRSGGPVPDRLVLPGGAFDSSPPHEPRPRGQRRWPNTGMLAREALGSSFGRPGTPHLRIHALPRPQERGRRGSEPLVLAGPRISVLAHPRRGRPAAPAHPHRRRPASRRAQTKTGPWTSVRGPVESAMRSAITSGRGSRRGRCGRRPIRCRRSGSDGWPWWGTSTRRSRVRRTAPWRRGSRAR